MLEKLRINSFAVFPWVMVTADQYISSSAHLHPPSMCVQSVLDCYQPHFTLKADYRVVAGGYFKKKINKGMFCNGIHSVLRKSVDKRCPGMARLVTH